MKDNIIKGAALMAGDCEYSISNISDYAKFVAMRHSDRIKELGDLADELTDQKLQMIGEHHPDWHEVRDRILFELFIIERDKLI